MTGDQGQCLLSCCPIRATNDSTSEIVTQILFGETYRILDRDKDWVYVQLDDDLYEGWMSNSQMHPKSFETGYVQYSAPFIQRDGHIYPMGSKLAKPLSDSQPVGVVNLARMLIGSPYLWGGKTFMGIDCSGLIQVVFGVSGVKLPRDSSQQVFCGSVIPFGEHQAGDLAFFHNENDVVTHVGIVSQDDAIIHSSGSVREDDFDEKGIRQRGTGFHTHAFNSIRRVG